MKLKFLNRLMALTFSIAGPIPAPVAPTHTARSTRRIAKKRRSR